MKLLDSKSSEKEKAVLKNIRPKRGKALLRSDFFGFINERGRKHVFGSDRRKRKRKIRICRAAGTGTGTGTQDLCGYDAVL